MTEPSRSQAVRAALKGHEPTAEQWHAIAHPLEPLYLIAGAGSGKTAVMAARIAWVLEEQSFSPSQILGLTFTNKAAGELNERVGLALAGMHDESGEYVTIQTYNAFAAGVVRDYGLLVNVEPESGLLSEAQRWQLLLSCLDDLPPFEVIEIRSSYVVGQALSLASSVADHIVNLSNITAAADRIESLPGVDEKMLETAAKRKELVQAVDAYIKAKHRTSRIDFGDQVTKAVEVLEAHLDVRDAYRRRFPFVLLDEYQDTNVAQRRMLQALIAPGGAVTAVGDARQAIFSWRGATMYNLIGFAGHFPRADRQSYRPVSLSENFRSGSHILAVANQVVAPIDEDRRPGDPLRSQPENGTGSVAVGLFSDEGAEVDWIAQQCEEMHGEPTAVGRDPVAWKDMAILVRRRVAMDMVLHALEERKIPVEVVGLGGLLKTPEVTEVVAWLRALESKPAANRWLARILLGPRWRVDYHDLSLLARWATSQNWELKVQLAAGDEEIARDMEPGDVGYSLAEALGHLDEIEHLEAEANRRLTAFAQLLGSIRKKSNAPLLELVQEIIRQAGILDALESSSSRAAPAARQNISNFLDQVANFAPLEGEATLRSFIAYLDAAEAAEETLEAMQPADQDSVKLMTVHAAKGLEFECVFVPSVAASEGKDGSEVFSIFPNTRAPNPLTSYAELPYEVREDADHLPSFDKKLGPFVAAVRERVIEDERRLFYVALTRAKQRLAVTASWWYGRDQRPKGPSLFWKELAALADDKLVEVIREDAQPPKNPLFDAMQDRRLWPPLPRSGLVDNLFPDGWGSAADDVIFGRVDIDSMLAQLPEDDQLVSREAMGAQMHEIEMLADAMRPEATSPASVPDVLSATSWVNLKKGELTAWDLVRPLPQRPTAARRIGTEVHRLIEERSRGMSPFPDEAELDEPSLITVPSRMATNLERWTDLYGERTIALLPSGEPMIEVPFTLKKDGRMIRGRIDAVYETDDGGLEIVDFKTGRRFEPSEEADQLELYREALRALGLVQEGQPLTVTYEFLSEPPAGQNVGSDSSTADEDWSS
ncbi:MAG: ATP-dependent helicase [Actinomycetota bacterium]|nr:ATP-dependent helicase [Actinomycetota bacterium]